MNGNVALLLHSPEPCPTYNVLARRSAASSRLRLSIVPHRTGFNRRDVSLSSIAFNFGIRISACLFALSLAPGPHAAGDEATLAKQAPLVKPQRPRLPTALGAQEKRPAAFIRKANQAKADFDRFPADLNQN